MLKMLNVKKSEEKQVGRQTKGKKTITEGPKKPVTETIQSEGTKVRFNHDMHSSQKGLI